MTEKKPHIIYILSDEHRGQTMRHMGDVNVETPAMDSMAENGASFSRAYANCPICTPSRGTIFSGRHAHAGPVAGFFDAYKIAAPSTATLLKEQGYHTAYFGKWHCGIVRNQTPKIVKENPDRYPGHLPRTPERHRAGFDDWFGFENTNDHFKSFYYANDDMEPTAIEGYETDGLTSAVMDYLKNYQGEKPLFLVLSVTPPHFPLDVEERWVRQKPEDVQLRPNVDEDTPAARKNLIRYHGMIENLDWNLGRLQRYLTENDAFKNTLSIYFSDHGDFMHSHGLACTKNKPQEESCRIPVIFQWSEKLPKQGVVDSLFSLVDILPTTLGLIDAPIPPHVQGHNYAPTLRGNPQDNPEQILLEMVGNPRWNLSLRDWRGLVSNHWKYAFWEDGEEWLFDLKADPYEKNNLAETNPEKRAEMKQALLLELQKTREPYFDVIMEYTVPQQKQDQDVSIAGGIAD